MICPGCGKATRAEHPACARRAAQGRAREADRLAEAIQRLTQRERDAILQRIIQKGLDDAFQQRYGFSRR